MVLAWLVNGPSSIEYSPLLMLMAAVLLIPDTLMLLEVVTLLRAAVTSIKLKASGVVSCAAVVTLNAADMPKMVKLAALDVLKLPEESSETVTVWLLLTTPFSVVNSPPFIEYLPFVILIGAALLMPVTVMLLDVMLLLIVTSNCSLKLKASGVRSCAKVVALKLAVVPPMFRFAELMALKPLADTSLTVIVWPLLTVPVLLVNEPPAMAYSPFAILMAASLFMPATVMLFEVICVSRATLFWLVKLKASGLVSCAKVLMVKLLLNWPTVRVAFTAVLNSPEQVAFTRTV